MRVSESQKAFKEVPEALKRREIKKACTAERILQLPELTQAPRMARTCHGCPPSPTSTPVGSAGVAGGFCVHHSRGNASSIAT